VNLRQIRMLGPRMTREKVVRLCNQGLDPDLAKARTAQVALRIKQSGPGKLANAAHVEIDDIAPQRQSHQNSVRHARCAQPSSKWVWRAREGRRQLPVGHAVQVAP